MACLEGVKLAHQWTHQQIVVTIIVDTLMESSLIGSVSFRSIKREQNKVAHELAHLALRSGVSRTRIHRRRRWQRVVLGGGGSRSSSSSGSRHPASQHRVPCGSVRVVLF
jgi:hypothetical protein